MQRKAYGSIMTALCVGFAAGLCSCGEKAEAPALTINRYSMSTREFDMEFTALNNTEDTPVNRRIFLDYLVNRKLILDDACDMGLDKENDFLKSIENFWEQSLLKLAVEKKMEEFEPSISVTEAEIGEYYRELSSGSSKGVKPLAELRETIIYQLKKKKQDAEYNKYVALLKEKASIKTDKKALGIE
ncbi:MAG: hypothetical protein HQL30_13000 [Candidatus Omnitrophica bacterium]|nr:hypothetical protein [Candidatus Omnitrophota bacterium]